MRNKFILTVLSAVLLLSTSCEKRGGKASPATGDITFLFCHDDPYTKSATQVKEGEISDINIFLYIASIVFPLALWCLGNWGLTTLFDGKGTLKNIYIATCYGMTPYPLLQFPLILFSNMVTVEEGAFYSVLSIIALVWCGVWIFLGMMQIHEFSLSKNTLFTVFSLFAMLVMIFILLLFFSMISQGIAYFISLGREIIFRM